MKISLEEAPKETVKYPCLVKWKRGDIIAMLLDERFKMIIQSAYNLKRDGSIESYSESEWEPLPKGTKVTFEQE